MSSMRNHVETEAVPPPIGIAGVACLGSLAVIHLVTLPFIGFLDRWGIQWLLYTSVPIAVMFLILYRSSWHQELGRFTRTLSMLVSACLLFCGVVLFCSVIATALFVVLHNFRCVHY